MRQRFCWKAVWLRTHFGIVPACALWWCRGTWGGKRAVPSLCIVPWHLPYNWGKITENLTQGSRKVPSRTVPGKIHLVALAAALRAVSSGLPTFVIIGLRFRWLGSALDQCKYLLTCQTKGIPASANLEARLSVRAAMWSAKNGTPKS